MSQVIRLEKWKFGNLTILVIFLWNEELKVSSAEKLGKNNAVFPEISGGIIPEISGKIALFFRNFFVDDTFG